MRMMRKASAQLGFIDTSTYIIRLYKKSLMKNWMANNIYFTVNKMICLVSIDFIRICHFWRKLAK